MIADPYYRRLLATSPSPEDPVPSPDGYHPPDVLIREEHVPGPHGLIPVRVYRPHHRTGEQPLLVWCHGGAFAFGDLDMPEADVTARTLAAQAEAVVVSVGYRLAADGVHYPVPLDDVLAAYSWAAEHEAAAPSRVHLGGASAGAALAAGACLRVRDAGGHLPSSLLLLYPCMHPVLPPASPELAAKLAGLAPRMRFAPEYFEAVIENYLGAPTGTATGYALPGLANLRGLPRTLLVNCEYDDLRASGEAFATSLRDAGVDVDARTAPGAGHGHLNTPGLAEAQRTLAEMVRWLREN